MTINDLIKLYPSHKIQLQDKEGNDINYARLSTKILGFTDDEKGTLYVTINY